MAKFGVLIDSDADPGERFKQTTQDEIRAVLRSTGGVTRTGIFSFELPHQNGTSWANQSFQTRRMFRLTQRPTRFRLHWRNHDQLANIDAAGTVSELQFSIGRPGIGTDGQWYGWTVENPPVPLVAPSSVASGVEFVSPWITPTTYQILENTDYQINQGLKAPSTGAMAISSAPSWQSYASGDVSLQGPTMERSDNASWGQLWIEYEYQNDDALRVMLITNSLSNGSTTAVINNGEMSAWWQRWALENDGIVANLGAAGIWAGHFNTANSRWTVFDGCATPYEPDVVIYYGLNSSDLVGGSLAVAKTNILDVLGLGRTKWPAARHYLTNVGPRSEISDDTDRLALNAWMHLQTQNSAVAGVLDIDSPLTNWATPGRMRAPLTAEGIHMSPQGHQVIAQRTPSFR